MACITGLAPGTNPESVIEILRELDFSLSVDCIRIPKNTAPPNTKAMVKVNDPFFADKLCARLKSQKSNLSAMTMPVDHRRTNSRKVFISWHKATRNVWLNFGNGEIANRVAQKFNDGRYKLLGQSVHSSPGKKSSSRGRNTYNSVAWTVTLSGVPGHATLKDVEEAIDLHHDKARHIEIGNVSYQASDAEVSITVRSRLEEHGPLENFYLAPAFKGKRAKAIAWFQDETDVGPACSLNNRRLDILGEGKLTVTQIHSAKVKIFTSVYLASKSRIDGESKTWKALHLIHHVYHDTSQRFTTLKVEGESIKDVANARKIIEKILGGIILTDSEGEIWNSALNSNESAYKNLKIIEKELDVVIIRDKTKRQLQFHGNVAKLEQAIHRITDMLREESSASYEIDLNSQQFSWSIHGSFRRIEQAMGKGVAVFNVVLKKIIINGTHDQYRSALAIMEGKGTGEIHSPSDSSSGPEGDCPICFCEADTPIKASCKHTYCLERFEMFCKSAASSSEAELQIKCQGDEGACSAVFTLCELKDHISSSTFETVLKSSFDEYIQRRPDILRYCPTPDCGNIYRCTLATDTDPKRPNYVCQNCYEPVCTSCHARHGNYTCGEYKDIASGGYEALEKLKKELNIKDCPKCTTPMEKTEGCNHMTCQGCRSHICWVCMAVFKASGPCYAHMTKEHGGIGLGLDRFMY